MSLWNAMLAPFNLGQYAPAPPPCANGRKARAPNKSYKPPPLITPFQKYKPQARASWVSDTASQYSAYSSISSSSSSSSAGEADPTPPGCFEPAVDGPVPEKIRLRMEFARLRLRGHSHRGRSSQNVFDHPSVRSRLERQRLHDAASLEHLPTQAPPVFTSNPLALAPSSSPTPARQSSYVVRRWHQLKKDMEARQEEQDIYAQIRRVNPAAATHWKSYDEKWAAALDADDSPPLLFHHIPWPIHSTPYNGSHITAVDVHRFMLSTTELDCVPPYALDRIDAEIQRWHTDRFAAQVLPRVVPHDRESVAAAAGAVLDILIAARRDIHTYYAIRRHTV